MSVDAAMLDRLAKRSGSTVHLLRAIGEFVPAGAALLQHDLLRRLAARPLPPLHWTTSDGRLAVLVPTPDFETYLVLAVEEIARYGSDSARVHNHLRGMLHDLHSAALPAHRGAIARQLQRWDERPEQARELDLSLSDVGLRPNSTVDSECL